MTTGTCPLSLATTNERLTGHPRAARLLTICARVDFGSLEPLSLSLCLCHNVSVTMSLSQCLCHNVSVSVSVQLGTGPLLVRSLACSIGSGSC